MKPCIAAASSAQPQETTHAVRKGQSGNPHGRPPDSRNMRMIAAEKLFEDAEALTRMAIDLAKDAGRAEKKDEKLRRSFVAECSKSAVALSCRFPAFRLFNQGRALINPCMSPSANR
jgi:hypothetical protein